MHWLADELLTALRLQEPPWDGLAAALGGAAFQSDTDPVVRDYIMQHIGHEWDGEPRNAFAKPLAQRAEKLAASLFFVVGFHASG